MTYKCLVTILTGLTLAFGGVWAQGGGEAELLRLRSENAHLRERLAILEALLRDQEPRPGPSVQKREEAGPVAAIGASEPAPSSGEQTGEGSEELLRLSPFEVWSSKDTGYLRTNAVTATRIGMEIQRVPMHVTVLSEDFLADTGTQSITDVLRYTSSGSPDSRYAMRVPGNSATPQGNFTLRGFTVNSLMRNGVFRYTAHNLDNVERVEVVKGPAAVFFGQGYPGGVINYVTKKPEFGRAATVLGYQWGSYARQKVSLDHNSPLSKTAALRITGAWSDAGGERVGEYRRNYNLTPSFSLQPFKSGKVRLNLELEYLRETYNHNDYAWIFPQAWFDAYKNPSPALLAAAGLSDPAAYRNRIFNSLANWIADARKAAGDPSLPLYTSLSASGFYLNAAGERVEDKRFNFTNSGARTQNVVRTLQTTLEASPWEGVDARYVFTRDNSRFDSFGGLNFPNADGVTYNAANGGSGVGYYRKLQDHQVDLIFTGSVVGTKHRLLVGGTHSRPFQQYMASAGAVYYSVPGYNYPTPPSNNLPNGGAASNSQVPVNQVLRDRAGTILTAQQVYSRWDPGLHVNPPVSKIYNIERNLLDGYKSRNQALYFNWEGRFLKEDRLTLLAGYRQEATKGFGQSLIANDPWFFVPETAYLDPVTYPENVYNYSRSYAGDPEGFRTRRGDSWMAGLSYALSPEVSAYASVSKTFKINTGLAGGYDELGVDTLLQEALAKAGGSFSYRGATISSLAQGRAALEAAGANRSLQNEDGRNYELGLKTSLWDAKLVGTFSVFRGTRENQKLDDSQAQTNASEPFNYSTTLFLPNSPYYNRRNFRWRTVGVRNQITGTEFDLIWTPNKAFQMVLNGAWLWQAETLENPSYAKPGTEGFKAATPATQQLSLLYYGNRIENVPEFRLNGFGKYQLTAGALRGLSLGLGFRYSSQTLVSRSFDFNPERGGVSVGDYLVFDMKLAYPWTLQGHSLTTSLAIQNLADLTYFEGNLAPAEGRNWLFGTSLSF